jgi:hypothetical protein
LADRIKLAEPAALKAAIRFLLLSAARQLPISFGPFAVGFARFKGRKLMGR